MLKRQVFAIINLETLTGGVPMSYEVLTEGLGKVKDIQTWSVALISYDHDSNPCEYTCYPLNFQSDELLRDTIDNMCSSFLSIVDKKDREVQEYTGNNPNSVIDKLSTSHALVSNSWNALIQSINESDDEKNLKAIKANANVFIGTYRADNEEKNIYLLSRKNPIYTYKKNRSKILVSRKNIIKEIEEPLIQFGKSFDAIIYKNNIYAINNNFESIFHMEYTHRLTCKKYLEIINEADIINDFEAYKNFALSGQHPKKFMTFDTKIIENIMNTRNLKILVDELKIPYDNKEKKFRLDDKKNAEIFTKAICGKTKYNMFTEGVCEVPTSTPLKIS